MINFKPPLRRYDERWKDWREKQPKLVKLRNKLLSISGTEVVPSKEPDIDLLLNQGDIIDPIEIININMQDSQCHRNSRILYLDDPAVTEIGTGWALSGDGLWRQHSWAMRGDEIVETTNNREKYYGVLLKDDALDEFLKMNI
jgi:hypothetical protein